MKKNNNSIKEKPNFNYNPFIYNKKIKEKEKYIKIKSLKDEIGLDEDDIIIAKIVKEYRHEYIQIGEGNLSYLLKSNLKTISLFIYICKNLIYNSDKIILDYKYVPNILNISIATFYKCIIDLIDLNIIAKSNIDYVFYINPLKIFKGNLTYLINKEKQQQKDNSIINQLTNS